MKRKVQIFLLLAAVLLSVFALGQNSLASNRYYTINDYTINVDVQADGSAEIEERITYMFTGSFNGVLRDIDYMLTDGMDNIKVLVEKDGFARELRLNSQNNLDDNGGSGTYNMIKNDEIAHLKVFEASKNERKTFIYKYTFNNVVTRYNDVAEFNRKIIDSGWDVSLNNATINIRLPEGAQKDDLKVFGHGSLLGVSEIIDERNVRFSIGQVSPGEMVETLVLFPTELVPLSGRVVAEDALPRIMENEKRLAEEANRKREEARRQVEEYNRRLEAERERKVTLKIIGNTVGALLIIGWFVLIIFLYIKFDKELKPSFEGKYYRELPGDYTPAEMSVLMSMGHVATRDITATLMDLIRKEQLLLTTKTYIKRGLFSNKEEEGYAVSLNPEAPPVKLKMHESLLIRWFIHTIGNGSYVILDEISDYAKTTSGAQKFSRDYNYWVELANEEAEKNNFFDKTSKKGKIAGLLTSFAFFGLGMMLTGVLNAGTGVVLIIQAIILFIFSIRLNRRTAYGNEQYVMWQAFKNFLKDFSRLDKAEIPSIVIWEHYLVYAISLGVAKEVIRQLPLVFTDVDFQNSRLTYMYGYRYNNFTSFINTFDRTIDTVDSAISRARAVANSTNSSSSGGGGGFSGGSSGGGGGRGGGGAF
jgi:uncharacterized membrane protein